MPLEQWDHRLGAAYVPNVAYNILDAAGGLVSTQFIDAPAIGPHGYSIELQYLANGVNLVLRPGSGVPGFVPGGTNLPGLTASTR